MRICMVLMMLVLASGCDGGITGDWFPCNDGETCIIIDDDGIAFRSDNTWVEIDAPGGALEPNESYCEEDGRSDQGTFTFDGKTLVMTESDGDTELRLGPCHETVRQPRLA